jgi:hypothetical protein
VTLAVVLAGAFLAGWGRRRPRYFWAGGRSSRGPSPPPPRRGWRRWWWPSRGPRSRRWRCRCGTSRGSLASAHRAGRRARAGGWTGRGARVRHAVRQPPADRAARRGSGDRGSGRRGVPRPLRTVGAAHARGRAGAGGGGAGGAGRARRRARRREPDELVGINDPEALARAEASLS